MLGSVSSSLHLLSFFSIHNKYAEVESISLFSVDEEQVA